MCLSFMYFRLSHSMTYPIISYHILSYLMTYTYHILSYHPIFISYSYFMHTSIHIAFPIFFLVSCLLYMALHILEKYDVYEITPHSYILIPLLIYFTYELESIQSDHPNSNYGIFRPTSHFTDFSRNSWYYLFFRSLDFIFDTISLYSFNYKVLRVLFQLESPNSEHRNSSYVRNNPDYSMFKTDAGNGLHMASL